MTRNRIEFAVTPDSSGQRLRIFLGDAMPLDPEEFVRHLISTGKALVNGCSSPADRPLRKGDIVAVEDVDEERKNFAYDSVQAAVLYEDEDVIVLDKPAGCTVVPERNVRGCPFINGVLDHLKRSHESEAAGRRRYRPRPVHRLDRDTTGAIVVAKSRRGELHLAAQFQTGAVRKKYLAVVHGEPARESGRIDAPVGSVPRDITRMAVDHERGKPAFTEYEVAERFRGFALVRAFPLTGRRHQVRLHLAHIGHPVVADDAYGGSAALMLSTIKRGYRRKRDRPEKPLVGRPALHAEAITFLPAGGEDPITVEAPLPYDMRVLLKMLRKYARRG